MIQQTAADCRYSSTADSIQQQIYIVARGCIMCWDSWYCNYFELDSDGWWDKWTPFWPTVRIFGTTFRLFGTIDLQLHWTVSHFFSEWVWKKYRNLKFWKFTETKCSLKALHDFFQSVFEVRSLSGMDWLFLGESREGNINKIPRLPMDSWNVRKCGLLSCCLLQTGGSCNWRY